MRARLLTSVLLLVVLASCTNGTADEPDEAVDVELPELGACRLLEPSDITEPDNDTPVVDCADEHTAETFAIGTFPKKLQGDIDDPALGAYAYDQCNSRFQKFLGGNESLVMRSTLTWAWFRPSQDAWDEGAHWWRCDVVGGGEQSKEFITLPETAKGVLLGTPDDKWMVCVNGPSVTGSVKIPCSEPHNWRAVTTIVIPGEKYPGDKLVEIKTQDFCSGSVAGWLSYPLEYDYGYTWFHEAEWEAGNRRSICWAKTDQ